MTDDFVRKLRKKIQKTLALTQINDKTNVSYNCVFYLYANSLERICNNKKLKMIIIPYLPGN